MGSSLGGLEEYSGFGSTRVVLSDLLALRTGFLTRLEAPLAQTKLPSCRASGLGGLAVFGRNLSPGLGESLPQALFSMQEMDPHVNP